MLIAEEYALRHNLPMPLLRYKLRTSVFQNNKSIYLLRLHWNKHYRRVGDYNIDILKFQHNSPEVLAEKSYEKIEWEYLENFFLNCKFFNSSRFFTNNKELEICKLKIILIKYDEYLSKQKDSILMNVVSEFLIDENKYLRLINYFSSCYEQFWSRVDTDLDSILEDYSMSFSIWLSENVR